MSIIHHFTNAEIVRMFVKVEAVYTILDSEENKFRVAGYKQARDNLEYYPNQLIDLYKQNKLKTSSIFGKSIIDKIIELFTTGEVQEWNELFKQVKPVIFELIDIRGIGPKRAHRLVTELNVDTIDDLLKAAQDDRISKLKGFGSKLQETLKTSIKNYLEEAKAPVKYLLSVGINVSSKIKRYLLKHPDVIEVTVCGSTRRRAPLIGDIDIAVSTRNFEAVLDYFSDYPLIEKEVTRGKTFRTVLLSSKIQVDTRVSIPEKYGSMLQHFTGSRVHNIKMREKAIEQGYSVSEHGIKNIVTDEMHFFSKEEDIYSFLKLNYVVPELRENELYDHTPDLVQLSDIKGDMHIHTSFPIETSHDYGSQSMEDTVIRGIGLNYEYICFSDHNPRQSNMNRTKLLSIFDERIIEVNRLRKKYPAITIYNMLEVDILPNGELAVPIDILNEKLDAYLVSIHSVFDMDSETMTKRILKGLSHQKAKIYAHPTGRILLDRRPISADWNQIMNYCAENDKALEINSSPDRTDLPSVMIEQARNMKIKLIISSDAHSLKSLDLMKYGVYNARRGVCTKSDIFNTRNEKEFSKWLLK